MSTGLYTQPQMPSPPPQYAAPPRRASGGNLLMSLLMIGGGFLILLSVLFVAGVWYAMSSLEGWIVDLGREGIVAVVEESELPGHEKTAVIAQVDRVAAAYKAGEIGQEELDELFIKMEDTPVSAYIALYGHEEHYLADTTLAPAEQEALRLACRRGLFGLFDGKISEDEYYAAIPEDFQYEQALANSPERTDELVRQWTRKLQSLCDNAGVPNDPPAVDVGGEMKKLVDELLAK